MQSRWMIFNQTPRDAYKVPIQPTCKMNDNEVARAEITCYSNACLHPFTWIFKKFIHR
jgi:hypothetical protein